jgi:hypothetical protein
MTSAPENGTNSPAGSSDEWRYSRDRVLLYVRGLDLPPFRGLDLAVESLKAAGPASPAETMKTLRILLAENGLDQGIRDEEGRHIASVPPLNRGVMVAEPLDRVPWKSALGRFLRRWKRNLFGPWENSTHA